MVYFMIKTQDGEDEMQKQARLMAEKYKDGPKKKGALVKKTQERTQFDSATHEMQKQAQQHPPK
ncbi:unnamed protein product (macronuclear) [Paramecium tetraurelia]|uniref:Small EDRK-rich factor-like N-terminal domain-containing protein n=1 Tax=Paramecium tetraurelia TaxID=5888 RepID=A0EHL5_PARTE|nr:uncharacterized protein GSPATT00027132001 [Paramecium tetraurelia]CAK94806.1 unnamed protein product [Paramecium tetraurelia]|eukprot:XP_001462179.1 hypothetical protein (macronuclear) [Paramecium tetraurelia strain d4-2]